MTRTIYEVKEKSDQEEDWEKKDDNILSVQVCDTSNNGGIIPKERVRVQIMLSKNAMLGLGSELIRMALDKDSFHCWHLDAATQDRATQVCGVFLHPDSPELIIGEDSMGSLDDLLD